jgi:hypothetical protein
MGVPDDSLTVDDDQRRQAVDTVGITYLLLDIQQHGHGIFALLHEFLRFRLAAKADGQRRDLAVSVVLAERF